MLTGTYPPTPNHPRPLPRRLCGPQRPLVVPPAPPGDDTAEPLTGELLPPEDTPDPHAVKGTRHQWGVALVCACLDWEAAVTGPSSLRWAQADHARHVTEAQAADADR
jgi:hypothetical protein